MADAFDAAEAPHDLVAALVELGVVLPWVAARFQWHDRLEAERLRQVARFVAPVGAVHDQSELQVVDAEGVEQVASDGSVMRLAWAQAEAEDLLGARGNQMNLGVEYIAAAADALGAP